MCTGRYEQIGGVWFESNIGCGCGYGSGRTKRTVRWEDAYQWGKLGK